MKILILLPQVARDASGGHKVILEYANKLVEYGHCVSVDYLWAVDTGLALMLPLKRE